MWSEFIQLWIVKFWAAVIPGASAVQQVQYWPWHVSTFPQHSSNPPGWDTARVGPIGIRDVRSSSLRGDMHYPDRFCVVCLSFTKCQTALNSATTTSLLFAALESVLTASLNKHKWTTAHKFEVPQDSSVQSRPEPTSAQCTCCSLSGIADPFPRISTTHIQISSNHEQETPSRTTSWSRRKS